MSEWLSCREQKQILFLLLRSGWMTNKKGNHKGSEATRPVPPASSVPLENTWPPKSHWPSTLREIR